jgi:hypothetical protein
MMGVRAWFEPGLRIRGQSIRQRVGAPRTVRDGAGWMIGGQSTFRGRQGETGVRACNFTGNGRGQSPLRMAGMMGSEPSAGSRLESDRGSENGLRTGSACVDCDTGMRAQGISADYFVQGVRALNLSRAFEDAKKSHPHDSIGTTCLFHQQIGRCVQFWRYSGNFNIIFTPS